MNRILSWKIDSGTYAYICPINGSHISNRIPEDSDLWLKIVSDVSKLTTEDDYKSNFNKMNTELSSKGLETVVWKDEYWNFVDENVVDSVNIVLLSGKDGYGSYETGGYGENSSEVYDKLKNAIDNELKKAKEDILNDNAEIKSLVKTKVEKDIAEAKKTIADTKLELSNIRTDLENNLKSAEEALKKATDLFESDGEITQGKLQDVLVSVDEYGDWMEEFSGIVTTLKIDYDEAGKIGSIGEAESVTDGLFSKFATSLNVVSGTVGNVNRWMVASSATIGDFASWYDTSADTICEASSFINASAGTIVDSINFISGDGLTNKITSTMDGINATVKNEILSATESGITNITNTMNGLSGMVETTINRLDTVSGSITSIGNRMNSMDGTLETFITKTDDAMSITNDLREHWSVESGKISSVINLVAETDENGNIIYYVRNSGGNEIVVYKNSNGEWTDGNNIYSDDRVYVHYSEAIGSYIHQEVSSITMSVMGKDNLTAAIKLAIKQDDDGNDTSIINMIADKVVIDANVIARAISANTANIGGIYIGNGVIYSAAKNAKGDALFRLDGHNGTLYAENANIKGSITASTLVLGGSNKTVESYIEDKVAQNLTDDDDVKEIITTYLGSEDFKNIAIGAGFVTANDFRTWAENHSGLTQEQIDRLSAKIDGAEISTTMEEKLLDDGGVEHTIIIGGEEYKWVTYDAGEYLLLGSAISGNNSSFIVSKNGLMQANNAIVYGKIYASEGEFKGKVTATEGSFKGSVTATTLRIGNNGSDIDTYIDGRIPKDLTTSANVQNIISGYVGSQEFKNVLSGSGYITQESLEEWAQNHTGLTEDEIIDLIEKTAGSEISVSSKTEELDDGGVKHTVNIGGKEHSWITYETDDYLLLNKVVSAGTGSAMTKFMVDKNGLLTANNAVVYGKIYASEGEFTGKIIATEGSFSGSVTANSGKIGGFTISNNKLISSGETAILNGSACYDVESDVLKIGFEYSKKKVLYAYVAYGSTSSGLTEIENCIKIQNQLTLESGETQTKFKVIYITEPEININNEEGELVCYYTLGDLNNDQLWPPKDTASGNNILMKFPASGLGTIRPLNLNRFRYSKNKLPGIERYDRYVLMANNILHKQISGSLTFRNDIYVRDSSKDLTYEHCHNSGLTFYSTRITSNGAIHCVTLNANEGMYGGEINSDGYFYGKLNCNNGTLNNTTLNNSNLYGTSILNNDSFFHAVSGSNKYFNVLPIRLNDAIASYYVLNRYSRSIKNSNGENYGKVYYAGDTKNDSLVLTNIFVTKGSIVTIPELNLVIKRYIPSNKVGQRGLASVECTFNNKEIDLINLDIEYVDKSATYTYNGSSPETILTATTDTNLIISIRYNIHLPTYSWLGADKATASISLDLVDSESKICVQPKSANSDGFFVCTDGFMVKCGNYGFKVSKDYGLQRLVNNVWTSGI